MSLLWQVGGRRRRKRGTGEELSGLTRCDDAITQGEISTCPPAAPHSCHYLAKYYYSHEREKASQGHESCQRCTVCTVYRELCVLYSLKVKDRSWVGLLVFSAQLCNLEAERPYQWGVYSVLCTQHCTEHYNTQRSQSSKVRRSDKTETTTTSPSHSPDYPNISVYRVTFI